MARKDSQSLLEELRNAIVVDRDALDEVLVRQPVLYHKASEQYAAAISTRDLAKDELKKLHAELYSEIKAANLEDGKKLTEAALQAEIEVDDSFMEASAGYIDCCKQSDMWLAAKDAFAQRAYILKDLVALWIAGYYGEGSVTGGGARERMEDSYDRTRNKVAEGRRSRNRYKR